MLLTTILSTKLAAIIVSVVVASGTLTGVAVAANNAAPGDVLYGLDCAMERVGVGDGGVQERLQEATKLVERGDFEQGLNQAAQAMQNQAGLDANGQANGALVAAAHSFQNSLQTANKGESDQMRAQAAEMLRWMSDTVGQGTAIKSEDFGQGVTTRAREIVGTADQVQTQSQLRTQTQDQTQDQSGSTSQNQSAQGSKGGK
jgi:hypothetical protein